MNCKCEEMEMVRGKMEKLNMAKQNLDIYNTNITSYSYKTECLCRNVGEALYFSHANSVQSKLHKMINLFYPISTGLRTKIDTKIAELSKEYGALKMADDVYHERLVNEHVSD